jgi:NAD(P)-dependent dehydrogenase (short-subunit alcohol dehydrogenase family)
MTANQVALITGANKGIGFEIARKLGHQGITVLMGTRDLDKGVPAAETLQKEGIDAYPVKLDVTDVRTIEGARQFIEQHHGKLDILVNNAGVLLDWGVSPSEASLANIRTVYETNFFGVIAVSQALLPLLRKSQAGRIVNLSSGLGSLAQNSDPRWPFYSFRLLGYNSSKTAVNAFTVLLAQELKDTPIKVNSADPDWCRTDMGSQDATHSAEEGADTPAWLATLPADGPTGGFFNGRSIVPW